MFNRPIMFIATKIISYGAPLIWKGMTSSQVLAVASAAASFIVRARSADLLKLAFGLGKGLATSPLNPLLIDHIVSNSGLPGRLARAMSQTVMFNRVIRLTGGAVHRKNGMEHFIVLCDSSISNVDDSLWSVFHGLGY